MNRRELVVLGALALAALLLAVVPGLNTPASRVGSYDADGPDPRYDAPLDGAAIRRAGELVPDGATYIVHAPDASPLLAGNLKAAAQLFLAPALPVLDARLAEWVVAYDAGGTLPAGLETRRAERLGDHLVVSEVER